MKFRSRSDSEVARLASTTGHIILVGQEFVEVPQHMESEAYANGCVSEELYNSIKADMAKGAEQAAKEMLAGAIGSGEQQVSAIKLPSGEIINEDRSAVVRKAIQGMLDGGEDGAFTAAGLPNLKVLSGKCGFQVSKDEMESVWKVVSGNGTDTWADQPGGEARE